MDIACIPGLSPRPVKPDLVFVDLETSGLSPTTDEILEIAAIRVDPETWIERTRFVAKVRPTLPVPREAAEINGYDPVTWGNAMSLDEALRGVTPVLEGARWVGSKPSFDFDFVSTNLKACGRAMPELGSRRLVDVSAMAEPLVAAGAIKQAGLEALRAFFEVNTGRAHRAENDALATMAVYRSLLRLFMPVIRGRV